jgi:hypothetical protein
MARRYLFLDGDPAKLTGWRFILDRRDGHGPELQPAAMREGDAFPESTVLCDRVGDCWQLTCLSNDKAQRAALEASIAAAASKAGLSLYLSAKAFAAAQPTRADAYLYAREPVLDRDGKPTGATQKKPGAPLQVAACLAGDDPTECADPDKAEAARIVLEEPFR